MNFLQENNKHIKVIKNWRNQLNEKSVTDIQEKLDLNEKLNADPFRDFSDLEMLQWYLFRKTNINSQNEKSKKTINEYKKEISLFIEHLLTFSTEINIDINFIIESSLFKSLSPRHIRRYQEWLVTRSPHVMTKGNYSAATITRKTNIIKSFLKFLLESNYIQQPLHTGFLEATVHNDDRPNKDLDAEEVKQLLDYFRNRQHPIVFALIHVFTTTGLRNEELCKLTVGDLKYDASLKGFYLVVTGKGNKKRQIPLKEKTLNSIKMFRYARGLKEIDQSIKSDPLFTTNTSKAYKTSYLSNYLTREIKKSQLHERNISCHHFRHAFAIISHKSGVDLYDISRSLGHEKLETTMIYLSKIFERENHAIHGWDSKIFGEYI
ncbi:tyrosine-type recombinase/integrase [Cytobacillus purgationiresistens]|uniref:Site-specific recombinase XerD n=1 Tax=Cytobacillus purgationiresistens TaxID=863449 RepID=A0ABU0AJ38_9BACI|nr:tyrosine-type recombinase/integrase [Cytobacillus purgationiresistens]MDQ0271271.1 site-specific recombinase XerD [Cytobacillus purgationiresistens]